MGNEIKEATFEDALYCAKALVGLEACEECRFYRLGDLWCDDTYRIMHEALEEIKEYRAIGTVEEFKAFKLGRLGNKGFITIGQTMEEYAQEIKAKAIVEVFDFLKTQRDKKSMKVNFDDLEIRKYKEQLKGGAE